MRCLRSDVTSGDEAGLRAVESAVVVLAGRSPTPIVGGISTFAQRAQAGNRFDVAAMSKPFVAARYLFAVPARVPIGRPRFASFTGIPVDGDFVDDLWPWLEPHRSRADGYFQGYVGEAYSRLTATSRAPTDSRAPAAMTSHCLVG